MSGGAEISSTTMSCLCPPEVEKEENYVWFLIKVFFLSFILAIFIFLFINMIHTTISLFSSMKSLLKVLYGQWIVMGSLALPIVARQAKNTKFQN